MLKNRQLHRKKSQPGFLASFEKRDDLTLGQHSRARWLGQLLYGISPLQFTGGSTISYILPNIVVQHHQALPLLVLIYYHVIFLVPNGFWVGDLFLRHCSMPARQTKGINIDVLLFISVALWKYINLTLSVFICKLHVINSTL